MTFRIIISIVAVLSAFSISKVEAASLSDLFNKVKGSVVVIEVEQKVPIGDSRLTTAKGMGSGVLISKDGLIITAAHVVQTADHVYVKFPNGEGFSAEVIASEPAADVALLKLRKVPKGAVTVPLGDSGKVDVGDKVFVVGAPYGMAHTLTVGHISARHEPYSLPGTMALAEFFQTDAAINQGNSGGPMFNMDGEVIGIVSHMLSKSGGYEGLGFVATSETAKEFLIERRSFWGGVSGFLLQGKLAEIFNLPQKNGVLVQQVAEGSPSSRMGLKAGTIPAMIGREKMLVGGDIILGLDHISLDEPGSYPKIRKRLSELSPGETATVKILRKGRQMELSMKLQ
jgi:S1-C subfamily serine protease